MEERDFFDEKEATKPVQLSCLHCRQTETYEIRWMVRTKKAALRGSVTEADRQRFGKWQSYMVRRDDLVQCKNPRCRKRFEISGLQSIVYL